MVCSPRATKNIGDIKQIFVFVILFEISKCVPATDISLKN
jgi:hypothetical protein